MNRFGTHGLEVDAPLFANLMRELARRGGGMLESGAFLLKPADDELAPGLYGWQKVTRVEFYDDLDPGCLTGSIDFTADGYTSLATICRRDRLQVAADIHTHPGTVVRQSKVDAAHPMVALPGHIALIAPRFACGPVAATELGVHVYEGNGVWSSYYGDDTTVVLRLLDTHASSPTKTTTPRRAHVIFSRLRQIFNLGDRDERIAER